jgi:hypothetical protein
VGAHRHGGPVRGAQPERGHDLLVIPLVFRPPFRRGAAIMAEKGKVGSTGNFDTYLTAPGAVHLYDGINLAALAMVEAKSTVPSVYAPYIVKVGDGTAGAVVVHSYAEGIAALKSGKAIRYEGPGGPTSFDSYHDSPGICWTGSACPATRTATRAT